MIKITIVLIPVAKFGLIVETPFLTRIAVAAAKSADKKA
jgi:hypothetical protein